jgi:hypothetical protein
MYLLALDEQYDWQAGELRGCLCRAEEVEIFSRMLEVKLAEAHANVAAAESRETALTEASRWTKINMPRSWRTPTLSQGPSVGRFRRTGTHDLGGNLCPSTGEKDWSCSTTTTSAFGGIRSRVVVSPRSAPTKRRSRSTTQCSRRTPRA